MQIIENLFSYLSLKKKKQRNNKENYIENFFNIFEILHLFLHWVINFSYTKNTSAINNHVQFSEIFVQQIEGSGYFSLGFHLILVDLKKKKLKFLLNIIALNLFIIKFYTYASILKKTYMCKIFSWIDIKRCILVLNICTFLYEPLCWLPPSFTHPSICELA